MNKLGDYYTLNNFIKGENILRKDLKYENIIYVLYKNQYFLITIIRVKIITY